jgi:hypothetical protein
MDPTAVATTTSAFVTTAICVVYALSSVSMLALNKIAANAFQPTPLVLWQLVISCVCIPGLAWWNGELQSPMDLLSPRTLVKSLPRAGLFLVVLQTSTYALLSSNVQSIVVFRSLTSLFTAIVESTFFGRDIRLGAKGALLITIIGAAIYAKEDIYFDSGAYMWVAANVVANSTYGLYSKSMVENMSQGPLLVTWWNNLAALCVLVLVELLRSVSRSEMPSVAFESLCGVDAFRQLDIVSQVVIGTSALVALSLSHSVTLLNKRISATALFALNNSTKILIAAVSPYLTGLHSSWQMQVGAFISLFGGALFPYFQTAKAKAKQT